MKFCFVPSLFLSLQWLSLICIFFNPSSVNAYSSLPVSLSTSMQYSFTQGPIEGYVQTPRGGRPGSSDIKQPTLARLGILYGTFFDESQNRDVGTWCFFRGFERIRPEGIHQLTSPLLTYGIRLPSGINLKSNLQFDWYRFGTCYNVYLFARRLLFSPEAEIVWWDFAYRFQTIAQAAVRAYHHTGLRLGMRANYQYSPTLSIGFHVASTFALTRFDISTMAVKFIFKLAGNDRCFVGVRMLNMEFKDGQTLPNDIHLHSKLLPIAGCVSG